MKNTTNFIISLFFLALLGHPLMAIINQIDTISSEECGESNCREDYLNLNQAILALYRERVELARKSIMQDPKTAMEEAIA